MSNKALEELLTNLGMTKLERDEVIDDFKEVILHALSFPEVVKKGAECSLGYLTIFDEDDKLKLPELPEGLEGDDDLLNAIRNAEVVIGGSATEDENGEKALDYILFVNKDGGVGIHNLNPAVPKSYFERLTQHLILTGLEYHPLISRVTTHANYLLEDDVYAVAQGAAAVVKVGMDGSYSIKVRKPSDIEFKPGECDCPACTKLEEITKQARTLH